MIGRITNSSQGRIQLQAFEFMQPQALQTVPIIDFVNITTNSIESPRGLIGSVNSLFGGYHAQEKPKLDIKTFSVCLEEFEQSYLRVKLCWSKTTGGTFNFLIYQQ